MGLKGIINSVRLPRNGGVLELPSLPGMDFENISVEGHDVVVPHSCGSDGNEHRFGSANFYTDGNVRLSQH